MNGSHGQAPDSRATTDETTSHSERQMLQEFDAQRRLQLLWVTLPGLFILALAAIPFALASDMAARTPQSTEQVLIGVVGFGVGIWAVMRRRVNVASFALFAGITGAIAYVLLGDGPLRGYIDLLSIPAFALLALPIVIAGVFGGPLPVAVTTFGTVIFTLVISVLTPHSADLSQALQHPNGYFLFTVTIAVQVALVILMFATTRGFQRTHRELGDLLVA